MGYAALPFIPGVVPKAIKPPEAPALPSTSNEDSIDARRRRRELEGAKSGAASTILTSTTADSGFGSAKTYLGAG